ncbi:MAG: GSCFA domain-containing protein [Candidatus Pseudobacter hemicellulosilyticus]|uniref:GSCFA domain-containing protein n=1 Tax=Candidatus Pseudobacter hemicellulosilyticus TaxID=3121375 RepID=A0AAJ5WQ95_9BACT|nr:MAG: GSCFA domain-containing protein [Pseudobacter sp.]
MSFLIDINIPTPADPIHYQQPLLITGSCFTEHIGNQLRDLKFNVLQNPHGILFDPQSVANSLVSYVQNRQYEAKDLFYLNEVWQSWDHHSRFSHMDPGESLRMINASQQQAHDFLKKAEWVVITLGSAFSYRLTENSQPVANCHRAPAQWFNKHLMTIEEINWALDTCLHQLRYFNPRLRFLFTISPVRHIRDGVVDNNRSKARLLEVVHHLVNKFDRIWYFPAYELVIDVLRDYRFYDIDMVHPNYAATQYVVEQFMNHFVDEPSRQLAAQLHKLLVARRHKPFHRGTEAHKKFLQVHYEKTKELQQQYPFLPLEEELNYFNDQS